MNNSFLSNIPPVVKNLIAVNIILFLAAVVLPSVLSRFGINLDLGDILGMHYWESTHFNPAQLVTYAFMHGGITHIFFNMFGLYMFGSILERVWGGRKFFLYYMVTAVGAALIQQLVWTIEFRPLLSAMNEVIGTGKMDALLSHESTMRSLFRFSDLNSVTPDLVKQMKDAMLNSADFVTVGASGSVFGLLLAFGWLFPEQPLYIMFIPIPIKAKFFVVVYGLIELFQGVANFTGDNVAHFAHLGGMFFGIGLLLYWKKKNTLYR